MLKIAIKHYRVPLWAVKGRKKGPPSDLIPDAERRHKKIAVSNRGGKTVATLFNAEYGHVMATGVSVCSMSDNFDYQIGRDKAIMMAGYAIDQSLMSEWVDAKRDFYHRLNDIPHRTRDIPRGIKVVPTITDLTNAIPQPDSSGINDNIVIATLAAIEKSINVLKINLVKSRLKR